MGDHTKIGWCDATANLWWGCEEVHIGCDHCYARVFSRAKGKAAAWNGVRFAVAGIWENLRKWQDAAARSGTIYRVFCGSMMDIFEKPLPASAWDGSPLGVTTGEIRDRFFREVVPACPNLLFLLLTKRPGNATKHVPPGWLKEWPGNVMTGASVVDQPTADTLIPQLLRVPGTHFLSVEPLLAPVDLRCIRIGEDSLARPLAGKTVAEQYGFQVDGPRISWVIAGCESGPGARPMDESWVRSLRDQCQSADVAFFYKQKLVGGRKVELPELDGRVWDQFPAVSARPADPLGQRRMFDTDQ